MLRKGSLLVKKSTQQEDRSVLVPKIFLDLSNCALSLKKCLHTLTDNYNQIFLSLIDETSLSLPRIFTIFSDHDFTNKITDAKLVKQVPIIITQSAKVISLKPFITP
jgi:hypothetical protein